MHQGGEEVAAIPKTEASKNKPDKNLRMRKIQSSPHVGNSKRSTNVESHGGRHSSSKINLGTSSNGKKDRTSMPKHKAQSKNLSETMQRAENKAQKVLSRSTKTNSTNVRVSKSRNFENDTAHLTPYSFNKIEENQQSEFTRTTLEDPRETEEQLDSHDPSKLIVEKDQGMEFKDQWARDDDDTMIYSGNIQDFLRNIHGSGE